MIRFTFSRARRSIVSEFIRKWRLPCVARAFTTETDKAPADDQHSKPRNYNLRAFYLANSIDVFAMAQQKQETHPLVPQLLQRNHVIFTLNSEDGQGPPQYIAVYGIGSAVLFLSKNHDGAEGIINHSEFVRETLDEALPFCKGEHKSPTSEDYTVVVDPHFTEWCEVGDNALRIQTLDIHNLRIIAETIGQSVALQYYESQAINMLKEFRSSNSTVIQEGASSLQKQELFKMIAQNNKILIDVMANLGLLDRAGPISWRYDKYYKVWEVMRDEFELQRRFKSVDDKISMVQDNAKFFLEVMHSAKGERLEWIIIVLIAGELTLGLYSHFQFHPFPFIN